MRHVPVTSQTSLTGAGLAPALVDSLRAVTVADTQRNSNDASPPQPGHPCAAFEPGTPNSGPTTPLPRLQIDLVDRPLSPDTSAAPNADEASCGGSVRQRRLSASSDWYPAGASASASHSASHSPSNALGTVLGRGNFGTVTVVAPAAGDAGADVADSDVPRLALKTVSTVSQAAAARTELAFARRAIGAADADDGSNGAPSTHVWHNIAEVFAAEVDEAAAELVITQELLPGGSVGALPEFDQAALNTVSPSRREERLRRIARDVLNGLIVLHEELRVVHRDIKPDNVLLAGDGTAKLIDFGCCALLSPTTDNATDQTGPVSYMSPERLRGEPHGPSSDVWALGVMVLELALCGEHPFIAPATHPDAASRYWALAEAIRHTSDDAAERRAATRAAVNAAIARARLPPTEAFACFIQRCCDPEPATRPSARSLLEGAAWLQTAASRS